MPENKLLTDYRNMNGKIGQFVDERALELGQLTEKSAREYIQTLIEYVQRDQ